MDGWATEHPAEVVPWGGTLEKEKLADLPRRQSPSGSGLGFKRFLSAPADGDEDSISIPRTPLNLLDLSARGASGGRDLSSVLHPHIAPPRSTEMLLLNLTVGVGTGTGQLRP